jgi:hypothetical protein
LDNGNATPCRHVAIQDILFHLNMAARRNVGLGHETGGEIAPCMDTTMVVGGNATEHSDVSAGLRKAG